MAAVAATADTRSAASAEPKPSRSNGRKLFIHDRKLGHRFVAGADEAGRGCLAGPLVAAAVLFDLERLTPRDVRALGQAQRLQAAHRGGARGALPDRAADRDEGQRRLALRARDRRARACTGRTSTRCATRCAASPGPGVVLPVRRLPARQGLPVAAARDRRRRHEERGDRRRVDRRQGHARPLHAPRRRAAPRLGLRRRTSATRRPSTARRSGASASRRCTA